MEDYTKQTDKQLILSLNAIRYSMLSLVSWARAGYEQAREVYYKIADEVSKRDLCNNPEYAPLIGRALQAKLTEEDEQFLNQ